MINNNRMQENYFGWLEFKSKLENNYLNAMMDILFFSTYIYITIMLGTIIPYRLKN